MPIAVAAFGAFAIIVSTSPDTATWTAANYFVASIGTLLILAALMAHARR